MAAAYLEQIGFDKNKLVYVVGSTGITQELDDVGIKYLPIGVSKQGLFTLSNNIMFISFFILHKRKLPSGLKLSKLGLFSLSNWCERS